VTLRLARSLFARTAILIAGTLAAFVVIAWAAIAWSTVIPAAEMSGHVLAQRALAAMAAYRAGTPVPPDVEVEPASADPQRGHSLDFPHSLYLTHLRKQLQSELPGAEIVVARTVMPTEVWIRFAPVPDRWFVLRWRVARPATPLAMIVVLLVSAILVLGAAALFARRMTTPLADLVAATERVAAGEPVAVDINSGPSEVRSLATAFQSMSNRLEELDEQRELMLAGLSHDLRSPLARVRVAVELLEGPNAALAKGMTEEIESIDRMIGQLMRYVRAGYQEQPVRACLDEIVCETLARHGVGSQLRLELGAPAPRPIAVESLRHILVNLVENAFEYGQSPVIVRTSQSPGKLHISVEDGGTGLSAREWQEAVRPFQRLRETPGAGHTGLGLAMVERLVRVCRGTLVATQLEHGFIVDVTLVTPRD
jgi:two-component system, OmpR family, osmolarity sensor histidine kinase EnvZ